MAKVDFQSLTNKHRQSSLPKSMYLPQRCRRSSTAVSVACVLVTTGMIVARNKLATGMLQKQDAHTTRSHVGVFHCRFRDDRACHRNTISERVMREDCFACDMDFGSYWSLVVIHHVHLEAIAAMSYLVQPSRSSARHVRVIYLSGSGLEDRRRPSARTTNVSL